VIECKCFAIKGLRGALFLVFSLGVHSAKVIHMCTGMFCRPGPSMSKPAAWLFLFVGGRSRRGLLSSSFLSLEVKGVRLQLSVKVACLAPLFVVLVARVAHFLVITTNPPDWTMMHVATAAARSSSSCFTCFFPSRPRRLPLILAAWPPSSLLLSRPFPSYTGRPLRGLHQWSAGGHLSKGTVEADTILESEAGL
jgi:hypothetical protein